MPGRYLFVLLSIFLFSPFSFIGLTRLSAAQEFSSYDSRFFTTEITLNSSPLRAESFFEDIDGRTIIQGTPLSAVISKAYDIDEYKIVDGPEWVYRPYLYDVKAVPPPAFVESYQDEMLQSLLEDRFQLKIDKVYRTMSVFMLELEGSATILDLSPDDAKDHIFGYLNADDPSFGNVTGQATINDFAEYLSGKLGQTVYNFTGLTQRYSFQFMGFIWDEPDTYTQPLLDHMGLRLRLKETLVEVLVITKVKHPVLDE